MRLKASPYWMLILLVAACFTLATLFVPRAAAWNGRSQSDNLFAMLLGQGRRLFGNEMFIMADVYFHSGYYPSIFDQQEAGHDVAKPALGQTDDDSTESDFFGKPPDWIAALDRHFVPNRHTHLSSGGPSGHEKRSSVQEILPWLKLAADMNPEMIETYTVGAYWLRRLNKPVEARDFLFNGLHHNPGNSELLFNLGQLYEESFHDTGRASNVWMAALRCWEAQAPDAKTNSQSQLVCDEIAMNLARLQQKAGNWPQAVRFLKVAKQVSPDPAGIQKQIDQTERKMAPSANPQKP